MARRLHLIRRSPPWRPEPMQIERRTRRTPAPATTDPSHARRRPVRRRRHPRPRRPMLPLIIGLAISVVTIGAFLSYNALRAEPSGAIDRDDTTVSVSAAHASTKPCASCHEPPAPDHFSAECSRCHTQTAPFTSPQLSHVTFGSHTQASQSCTTCHSKDERFKPSCRSCHANMCGKGVTTAAGCLKCHRTGTADEWVPSD